MDAPRFLPYPHPHAECPAAQPTRDVRWVLRWASLFVVIATLACVVVEFGYRLSAERAMYRASRAGVREAALPRASRLSVERTIRQRLGERLARSTQIAIARNSLSVRRPFLITLTAPADAALPDWLALVSFWNSAAEISASAGQ
jgi:hypothetical protein